MQSLNHSRPSRLPQGPRHEEDAPRPAYAVVVTGVLFAALASGVYSLLALMRLCIAWLGG